MYSRGVDPYVSRGEYLLVYDLSVDEGMANNDVRSCAIRNSLDFLSCSFPKIQKETNMILPKIFDIKLIFEHIRFFATNHWHNLLFDSNYVLPED